jgi:hypothetical protein
MTDRGQQQLDAILGQRGFSRGCSGDCSALLGLAHVPARFAVRARLTPRRDRAVRALPPRRRQSCRSGRSSSSRCCYGGNVADRRRQRCADGGRLCRLRRPVRKLAYNLTVTGISVIVAVVVGGSKQPALLPIARACRRAVEIVGAAAGDISVFGYAIVALLCSAGWSRCWSIA